jgi:RNA polymerase sigma factor (TIGR02999 family)
LADGDDITCLLAMARAGDASAVGRVFAAVYDDLRKMARRQLSVGRGQATLNATALVHEVYLKVVHRASISPEDRRHFYATAARAMRQVAIDYARACAAAKRGGAEAAVTLNDDASLPDPSQLDPAGRAHEILVLDAGIQRLWRTNAQMGQVVELRFFGGFSVEESADVLGISPRTVKRLWRTARAILQNELDGGKAVGPGSEGRSVE